VRALTKASREDEQARGDLLPVLVAEEKMVEMHSAILGHIRGMFAGIARTYEIDPTTENEEKWSGLVDEFCLTLQKEVFSES
jgi:hypothetical protein